VIAAFVLIPASAAQARPAVEDCPDKRLCVEVVVDGSGCPSYTRYEGVKDKWPVLEKTSAKKMLWYIVNEQGDEQRIAFKAYFDPFQKPEVSGVGSAKSKNLDRNVPTGVSFKYTVVVDGCEPLDPMIRIIK
jgi:hypothetical protein